MFAHIELQSWRQFEEIDIAFHERLTILTGANGSGKTTILHLLNKHVGWNLQFISTPVRGKKGALKYLSDFWTRLTRPQDTESQPVRIGQIRYDDDGTADLLVPREVTQAYQVQIQNQRPVPGLYVPSHRAINIYQKVEQIPTHLNAKQQLLDIYLKELRNRYAPNTRVQSASFRIKEALIALAIFGYGNEVLERNDDAVATFEGFQSILQTILPPQLGFKRLAIRMPEVVLQTESGDFSFDAVSGGISAIIDLAWQLYISSQLHDRFVALIDEPENHLHPELQRTLFPQLLRAFPSVQFIAATHNPFIVGSVPESNVYVLGYNDKGRVESTLLDMVNKAGSSNEILREVLGLSFTTPLWAEERYQQIVRKCAGQDISAQSLTQLKKEMSELGLDHLFPSAINRVLEGRT